MTIKILDINFSVDRYNEMADHPLQSWQWGEARKKMGIEVLRIGEFSNENQLKNVFQVTFHAIPHTSYKIGYLPRSAMPDKHVLEFLHEYAKKANVLFIKIEPDILKKDVGKESLLGLTHSPHGLFPNWTQVLDLKPSEDELLKKMHPKTRYNIRLAQKKGVIVKEMSDIKGFEIFSKLFFSTTARQKYFGHSEQYHQTVWNSLKEGIAHILIAFYQDIPLASYELFLFKNKLYYPYGGTSKEHRNVMAPNLLMWEAIRFGKKSGAELFDMWGSLGPNYEPNSDWAGFTRFKEGYGTEFVEFVGSYDLVVQPLLYPLYTIAYSFRNFYLQLRSML